MQEKTKLLIATTNPGKLNEIKYFLKDLPIKLLSLHDIKISESPEEDGKTFKENAIKKAQYYFNKINLPVIADDGGLEIDFFNGEPGVKSKRWIGGKKSSDEELINYTLSKMKDIPWEERGAQLKTVLVFIDNKGKIHTSQGIIRGIISNKPCRRITKGYPYRAIFYIPKIKTYYSKFNLSREEFEKYSHRGQALKKIIKIIKETIL